MLKEEGVGFVTPARKVGESKNEEGFSNRLHKFSLCFRKQARSLEPPGKGKSGLSDNLERHR